MTNDTNAPKDKEFIPLDDVMEQIFEDQPDLKRKIDDKLRKSGSSATQRPPSTFEIEGP